MNGKTGVVTLTTTDIAEGTSLYFTDARVTSSTQVAANTAAIAANTTAIAGKQAAGNYLTDLTGDVTATGPTGGGSAAATIANDAVTNAKLANMATQTFKGRTTAGTGDPEDLSIAQAKTLLNLTGTNSGDQTITLTGDVTGSGTGSFAATVAFVGGSTAANVNIATALVNGSQSGSKVLASPSGGGAGAPAFRALVAGDVPTLNQNTTGTAASFTGNLTGDVTSTGMATTIANDAVTNAKAANMATATFKGRTTAGIGDPEDLTVAQAKALLNLTGTNSGDQTITLTGDVTGTGTGSFAATIAADAVDNTKAANMATSTIKGRATAGTGDPEDLTATQVTALLNLFTSTLKGLVPASGGGTTTFLRADGTFATPAGGGGGGSLSWTEDVDSPTPIVENSNQVYAFQSLTTLPGGGAQSLYALVLVPTSYIAGNQIKLKTSFYSPDSSGTALVQSVATLIRTGTDAITSTANQRTSTNTAVTLSAGTVNIPQAVTLDLTSATGTINGVAVAAGNLIQVKLTRGTDTATSDLKLPVYGTEMTVT